MEADILKSYNVSKEYESQAFSSQYKEFLKENFLPQEAFTLECLQKIYNSGRISGTRLLDFGCGPTVHRIASASLHFNEIVLSEWAEANRKEVEKWLRGDKDALDWTFSLEQCARAEGFRNVDKGVTEIERRIREAVKKVVPCDALSNDILPGEMGEFDAISTTFCLESSCFSTGIYKNALRKLTKYLKKGGAMIMASVLEAKSYTVHKSLPGFYLTEDAIKEALSDAGLELSDWFCWKETRKCDSLTYGGTSVYYCFK